jgi:hypothetical protein
MKLVIVLTRGTSVNILLMLLKDTGTYIKRFFLLNCITITNVDICMKWKLLLLSVEVIDFQTKIILMLMYYKLNVRNV